MFSSGGSPSDVSSLEPYDLFSPALLLNFISSENHIDSIYCIIIVFIERITDTSYHRYNIRLEYWDAACGLGYRRRWW